MIRHYVFWFMPAIIFVTVVCGGQIVKHYRDNHKSQVQSSTFALSPDTIKHYTITLAGQIFHTDAYIMNKDFDFIQFRDENGTNVVLYDLKAIVITENK